jgi:hypothetical protein
MLPIFTTGRLPSKSAGATSRRIRRQLRRALPPPFIDDFDDDFNINDFDIDLVPPSTSPTTTTTVSRYNPRDLILSFILSNMSICRTSILYIFDLVHLFYMIYILFLIWKLPNYLTVLTSDKVNSACLDARPFLNMSSWMLSTHVVLVVLSLQIFLITGSIRCLNSTCC